MQFNSGIFVFLFLPITMAVFYILKRYAPTRIILSWLVLASFIFYGWWNPVYLGLIAGSIIVNYGLGILGQNYKNNKPILTVAVLLNLGLLGYFKYFNFFIDNIEALSGSSYGFERIALPLAISFFTFQQIAYQVDIYRKECAERNFMKYALFVTFFPQLIAGPIVHHKEMMPQIETIKTNDIALHGALFSGLLFFCIGLFKKVILADALAEFANPLFDTDLAHYTPTAWESWASILSYTGQIYFDFSGYCDMAMGLALFFGVRLPVNFASPYKARNISEFWRTWHITLGRFLRDYLYIPLGGNRVGSIAQMRNVIVVMLLGGLWHGASWTFVIWGGIHGALLAIHATWSKLTLIRLPHIIAVAITFFAVSFAWIFFRADTLSDAITILSSLHNFDMTRLPYFYDAPITLQNTVQLIGLTSFHAFYWIIFGGFIIFLLPNSIQIHEKLDTSLSKTQKHYGIGALLGGLIFLMIINACKETNEFIYFNF
ncbi:MAG: membrane-bound O-acyltransferase family protein [Alphaproteobacteria bacterium]|nr:MAG: membrane-bound O-acyltransferase family protein [Alphaproteobacteria bacterium]